MEAHIEKSQNKSYRSNKIVCCAISMLLFVIVAISPILSGLNQNITTLNVLIANQVITIIASTMLIAFINNSGLLSPILFILSAVISIASNALSLEPVAALIATMGAYAIYMLSVVNLLRSGAGHAKFWLLALYVNFIFIVLPPLVDHFIIEGVYNSSLFDFKQLWMVTNWINSYLVAPILALSIIATFCFSNIYKSPETSIKLLICKSTIKDIFAILITMAVFVFCVYGILVAAPYIFEWMGE